MKPKTLHFRLTSISRNKERPDNAIKACAYRSGLNLMDRKTGEVHRYARRGGVVQIGLFASEAAPDWTQDDNQKRLWERFGNEIEAVEDSHNRRAAALLAKDLHAAAPRELSLQQSWNKIAVPFARKLTDRGLAVAVALHETDASDGGKNPHFHFLIAMRQTDKDGFSRLKERWLDSRKGVPNPELMTLRREYFALVNDALADAGIDGIAYDPNKQEGTLPGIHKGRAVTAMERRGIVTQKGEASRRVALENKARPFYAGLEQMAEHVFSNEPGANAMEKLHSGMNRMREAKYAGRAALGGNPNGASLAVPAVPVVAPMPELAAVSPAPAPDPLPAPAPAAPPAANADPPGAASTWQDYVTRKKEPDREPER